ncbi:PqqD family peptide modification chaperone [Microbacterium lacticum]
MGGITRVRYRDAADLAAVLPALAHPDPRWIDPPPVPDASRPQPPRAYEDDAPSYTRVDVVDTLELRDPERLAVLSPVRGQEAKVHVLAGVAPAIWRAAVGASVEALCEAAVAEYGVPAGASASGVVQRAVSELVGAGLLRRSEAPRWSVCPDVAWADREGRVVLLDVREPAAQPAALGGSASVIWRELAAGAVATSELVARVARAVGVEEELVDADVRTFVAGLVEARLVVPRASTEIDSSDLTDP